MDNIKQYIHIRSLEKYHPGYKDRELKWAKMFFNIVQGDPEFELIDNEIDKWRYLAMICLELQAKKPLPDSNIYWTKKGFDLKKRPMSLTIQMLHNFLETIQIKSETCVLDKEVDKEKEKRVEVVTQLRNASLFIDNIKSNPAFKHIDVENELAKMDAWLLTRPGRKKTQRFIVNWLNKIDKPVETPIVSNFKFADKDCKCCQGSGFVFNQSLNATQKCECTRRKDEKSI